MIKVLTFLYSVILIVNAIELDEATKQLLKEMKKVNNYILEKSNLTDCFYTEALTQLDYNNTASPLTATFREQCKVEKFDNDCHRDYGFVLCLLNTLTKKLEEIELKCAEEYNTTYNDFYEATEEEQIKNQDLACYKTCCLKAVDNIKEDGTINLEDIETKYKNFKCNVTEIAVECIQLGNEEDTECSKYARILSCIDLKMISPDCRPEE